MRSETRKLAGIATVVCGGMASLGAGAVESDISYAAPAEVPAGADTPVEPKAERVIPLAEAKPLVEVTPPARPLSYAAPITVSPRADKPVLRKSERAKDDPNWPSGEAVALSEERLDNMRGGFDLPSGLKVSFGISRVAFVNGNLVTTTNFNIPDVSMITAQQAQALVAANTGALIQNGHGNFVQPASLPALTGSIIQNTLNNQHIQALTTINTSVNSLAIFQNMNIMSTLNNALTSAVRGK